jgi:hypothetical protein
MPNLTELTDRNAVIAAIEEYDRLGRDSFLERYGFGRSRRYSLRYEHHDYDVKAIVGVAFGKQYPDRGPLENSDLTSGLRTTVPKLKDLGFEVVENEAPSIGDALLAVMENYEAPSKRGGRELDDLVAVAQELGSVSSRDTLKAVRSMGVGRWPNVPWMALLDSRETESTRRGVYPVYLFRSDLQGVYLTLNQGVEETMSDLGVAQTIPSLQRSAEELRQTLEIPVDTSFTAPRDIDLGAAKGRLARSYEAGCIMATFYPADALPSDPELEADLEDLLEIYDRYLKTSPTASRPGDSSSNDLGRLIEEWRVETSYPKPVDLKLKKQRAELAERMSEENLLAAIDDPQRFADLEFSRFAGPTAGGPGPMAAVNSYLNSGDDAKVQVAQALHHLLYDGGELSDRINDVLLRDEWSAEGFKVALITKALWISLPDEWIPVFNVDGPNGKSALMKLPELGIEIPEDVDDLSDGHRIEWSNAVLRDKLRPHLPGDTRAQSEFLYWLRDRQPEEKATETITSLAEGLLLDAPWLEDVIELLEEKGQVIFQGPPGTGKTFVARKLAQYFERLGGGYEIVQFHPSYSYEDFIEGYRPRMVSGKPGFELTAGPLMRLARRAAADKDHAYVLIIDELNRGNVAKVFGEMYFLLEYRDERIRLQYSQAPASGGDDAGFALPRNLWIIATMNTSDRSIALMDGALRRRFYFIDYFPDQPPVSTLLERWYASSHIESKEWLPKVLAEANKRLGDRGAAIGPSHFMVGEPEALDEKRIARIWKHSVVPYLEERLMGAPERIGEFTLPVLRKAVEVSSPAPGGGAELAADE